MTMVNFIDEAEVKLQPDEEGKLKVSYRNGEQVDQVKARRLFPHTRKKTFIHLVKNDEEVGIIRNMDDLDDDSRRCVEQFLERFYVIPRISDILSITEEYGISQWKVATDRGERVFEIKNRTTDIKTFPGNRLLIRDSNNNLYEIPDHQKLPERGRILVEGEI